MSPDSDNALAKLGAIMLVVAVAITGLVTAGLSLLLWRIIT